MAQPWPELCIKPFLNKNLFNRGFKRQLYSCLICFYIYPILTVNNISFEIDGREILKSISFSIKRGNTLCLIGKSGSGKTTLAKCLNRLNEISTGEILLNNQNIRTREPDLLRRDIGFVLQEAALFPHWTIARNIATVPRLKQKPAKWISNRISELLQLVHLDQGFAKRFPSELSGGEAQRVSIARAMAADPEFIIFDEPFSALDPITRTELQNEIIRLKSELELTSVFVTHDMNEAFLLGDQILILDEGKVVQLGTPREIQKAPANEYVESLIASQNA